MSKREYNLESARARLEANGVHIQGTAIFLDEGKGPGITLWGAIDYLTSEMGFRVNPTDVKKQKIKRKKKKEVE
jgi:hypothetical protein